MKNDRLIVEKAFVVHQHHHYGWTMNEHVAGSPEEAMKLDLLKYHPWLPEYGHTVEFKHDDYIVRYAGHPYPRAFGPHNRDGDYWFGDKMHFGKSDDCNKCGGTGKNHYYSWKQCWACGDQAKDGKGTGKRETA